MNRFMIIGIAALMLAACTADGLKERSRGKVIDFRATTATKVAETTTSNFDSFTCTAINSDGGYHFENEVFERIGGVYYYSATDYYWPSDGENLDFYAWSPAAENLPGTVSIDATDKKLTGFTADPDISEQVDFISATASGNGIDNASGLELNFSHNLSQIEVKSRSKNTGYIYKIKGVRFGNIFSTGDFDFETGEWSNITDKATYTVEYSTEYTIDELTTTVMKVNGDNAMFVPQEITSWDPVNDPTNTAAGAYIAVKARITTSTGIIIYPLEGDYDWVAVPIQTNTMSNWESGYRYIYTLDWSTGGGYVYPEKPAYGDDYTGIDIFDAGEQIMSTSISLGLVVHSWETQYPDNPEM